MTRSLAVERLLKGILSVTVVFLGKHKLPFYIVVLTAFTIQGSLLLWSRGIVFMLQVVRLRLQMLAIATWAAVCGLLQHTNVISSYKLPLGVGVAAMMGLALAMEVRPTRCLI